MFLLAGVILSPPPKKIPKFAFSRNVAAEESGALSWFLVLFEIVWPKVFLSPLLSVVIAKHSDHLCASSWYT